MTDTLQHFNQEKNKALEILKSLSDFISTGSQLGVSIHPALIEKVKKSIKDLSQEKLRIALIGGFSEGKTSIAAAWLERLDESSMNINQQESSNVVKIYDVGNQLTLIDTPGLYGFKEEVNTDTQAIEKYKDITKHYVSEAHLVLYVMNSTNPIKESHKDDLQWLFRTLNLLPRTVFVLSRFDEVADVEDESDYLEKFFVKKESIQYRLNDMLQLNDDEKKNLAVVAVAANPFGLGTKHWLAHMPQFKQLSHIAQLQEATQHKIVSSGGASALANEVKKSIISDVIQKQLPIAKINFEQLQLEDERLGTVLREQILEKEAIAQKIVSTKVRLKGKVIRYFQDIIFQIESASQETFTAFYRREIGDNGTLINLRIEEFFNEEINNIALDINRIQIKVDSEISHFQKLITTMGKQGIHYVTANNLINNSSVLMVRDGINAVTQTIGLDISKYLKFKPWGATKLANGLSGILAGIGLALEVWEAFKEMEREQKFRVAIEQMKSNISQQSDEIVSLISADDFVLKFFPTLTSLQTQLNNIQCERDLIAQKLAHFQSWYQLGKNIDRDFSTLQAATPPKKISDRLIEDVATKPVAATPKASANPTPSNQSQATSSRKQTEAQAPKKFWQRLFS